MPDDQAPRGSTETQARAIWALCGQLGREVPELIGLTWHEAGDLIVALRAELHEREQRAVSRA